MHLHTWTYRGQLGLHDFVCAEAYSVCCQGYQQGENYSSLNLERMRETASLLAASVDRKERIFPILRNIIRKEVC